MSSSSSLPYTRVRRLRQPLPSPPFPCILGHGVSDHPGRRNEDGPLVVLDPEHSAVGVHVRRPRFHIPLPVRQPVRARLVSRSFDYSVEIAERTGLVRSGSWPRVCTRSHITEYTACREAPGVAVPFSPPPSPRSTASVPSNYRPSSQNQPAAVAERVREDPVFARLSPLQDGPARHLFQNQPESGRRDRPASAPSADGPWTLRVRDVREPRAGAGATVTDS